MHTRGRWQKMDWREVGNPKYCSFYWKKSATTSLFETLWHHRIISGFFRPDRHHDVIEALFDAEAGMLFDHRDRRALGPLSVSMLCYIKHNFVCKHPITKKLRKNVLEHYGYKCYYCGDKLTGDGSDTNIHHLTPEKLRGKTNLENLRPACLSCHRTFHESLGRKYWEKKRHF